MEFNNQLKKYVRYLHQHKHRQKYNKFIAEGPKVCLEFLTSQKYPIEFIFCTNDWLDHNNTKLKNGLLDKVILVTEKQLSQISNLKTANKILIVLDQKISGITESAKQLNAIYLDEIKDPGNMGTLIRIADWYGLKKVYASKISVDFYNPKVIQSAMGSHNRVHLIIDELSNIAKQYADIFGLYLSGIDISTMPPQHSSLLIVGNESKGIKEDYQPFITKKLTIAKLGGAESLNAAVATGIACYQLFAIK